MDRSEEEEEEPEVKIVTQLSTEDPAKKTTLNCNKASNIRYRIGLLE